MTSGRAAPSGAPDFIPFVDDFLPEFDVESRYSSVVSASCEAVYSAARTLDLSGSWTTRALFRLRGLPVSALSADGLSRLRFKPLIEDPPTGFALGIVGQFWRPTGRLLDFDPSDFVTLEDSGYARAVWSFDIAAIDDGASRLRTVTRVRCPDVASRRRFLLYWKLIAPFSGWIRREALRTVKRSAEGSSK